jgi:mRNA interferase MazF
MAKTPARPKGQKQKVAVLRRGEIYLCSFDPTVGHEIKKTRPALIIQNDVGNRYSPLTIVAAVTSSLSAVPYPVEVVIEPSAANGLTARSSIRLDQIRTVDRQRLIRRVGTVDAGAMAKVDEAIKISLGLIGIRP